MEILKGLDICVKNSAVSLGKFDGLHRGHRLLLHEILEKKNLFLPCLLLRCLIHRRNIYIHRKKKTKY